MFKVQMPRWQRHTSTASAAVGWKAKTCHAFRTSWVVLLQNTLWLFFVSIIRNQNRC